MCSQLNRTKAFAACQLVGTFMNDPRSMFPRNFQIYDLYERLLKFPVIVFSPERFYPFILIDKSPERHHRNRNRNLPSKLVSKDNDIGNLLAQSTCLTIKNTY
uniref:Uncharacterized protein n=1 Tax=Opuntia streptacantha TaxID=393608 RepID=A0A7C8YNQ5_OPUST